MFCIIILLGNWIFCLGAWYPQCCVLSYIHCVDKDVTIFPQVEEVSRRYILSQVSTERERERERGREFNALPHTYHVYL